MRLNWIYNVDCVEGFKMMGEAGLEADLIVTSPPYWCCRDYGLGEGQLGWESDFNVYVDRLVNIFREGRRVLKKTGSLWVNLGDSYYSNMRGLDDSKDGDYIRKVGAIVAREHMGKGLLPRKSLTLVPFRFAIRMVDDGWICRNVIIWRKPNAMPSPVKDRFTVDFEYFFFFVRSRKYYFKQLLEPIAESTKKRVKYPYATEKSKANSPDYSVDKASIMKYYRKVDEGVVSYRNKRCVWDVPLRRCPGSHTASYNTSLIEPIVESCSPVKGLVVDPFMGSGTTGVACIKLNRNFLGFELNGKYVKEALNRIYKGCLPII